MITARVGSARIFESGLDARACSPSASQRWRAETLMFTTTGLRSVPVHSNCSISTREYRERISGTQAAGDAYVQAEYMSAQMRLTPRSRLVQLAQILTGQTATVETDRYPGRRFSAKVTSVSPSTGSQFSLLPPESATGNWVKVVQRVPVRLQLTDVDAEFLLHARLSANVTVDTHAGDPTLTAETGPTSAGAVPR
jgi:hypothetical protein